MFTRQLRELERQHNVVKYSDSKMKDLLEVLGQEVSENFSPTLRAKLIGINEYEGTCIMEVVPSPYKSYTQDNHRAGERYMAPVYRIWNAYFF